MSFETELLREAALYASKKPRRVVSADCTNYPYLRSLYSKAAVVRSMRPEAKQFSVEGVHYAIVWLGTRMAVLHMRSGRVLGGSSAYSDDSSS
jgi:hypothetical protein